MPAATPPDLLALPRIQLPETARAPRPVLGVADAITTLEGEGFQVRRAFPGIDRRLVDPFLLLDHLGAVEYAPGEAKGAPDHPHRGFETVTYIMDGAIEHKDSTGGGGLIRDGDTQWMTAGAGIVHSEMPPEELVMKGGLFHGIQLWVNLPRAAKWTPARYQDLERGRVTMLASEDGGALVRLIAGEVDGHEGPGMTHTPITLAHASVSPGAQLQVPWRSEFNALVYVLAGAGTVGAQNWPLREGQLAVLDSGDFIRLQAEPHASGPSPTFEVLLLGGQPIREPVVHYGPFVMNAPDEIYQAIEDYRSGRMGSIPATRA